MSNLVPTKSQIGLGNVDNTSDANKPVSTAQATSIATKATIATTLAGYGITNAYPLSGNPSAFLTSIPTNYPQWIKVTKLYSDFATAGLTNDISIYTLPIKGYITDVKIIPTTAFSGGLISAYTISVGISGLLTKYAVATNVFTGNTTLGSVHTPISGLESTSGTTDIRAQATAVTGLLNAATAGSVDVYLLISVLP